MGDVVKFPEGGMAASALLGLKVIAEIDRANKARPRGFKTKPNKGEMPCPKCGKTIKWVWKGPRNMVAACQTVDCFSMRS